MYFLSKIIRQISNCFTWALHLDFSPDRPPRIMGLWWFLVMLCPCVLGTALTRAAGEGYSPREKSQQFDFTSELLVRQVECNFCCRYL